MAESSLRGDIRAFTPVFDGLWRRSNPERLAQAALDCFAEPVIGPATSGRTRWLAMTISRWRADASSTNALAPLILEQPTEEKMPMLFWLPMIIFSGMWTMAVEAASRDPSHGGDAPRDGAKS